MTGRRKKKFESIKTVLLYVALIFMAFIMLIPFAWMISAYQANNSPAQKSIAT